MDIGTVRTAEEADYAGDFISDSSPRQRYQRQDALFRRPLVMSVSISPGCNSVDQDAFAPDFASYTLTAPIRPALAAE